MLFCQYNPVFGYQDTEYDPAQPLFAQGQFSFLLGDRMTVDIDRTDDRSQACYV